MDLCAATEIFLVESEAHCSRQVWLQRRKQNAAPWWISREALFPWLRFYISRDWSFSNGNRNAVLVKGFHYILLTYVRGGGWVGGRGEWEVQRTRETRSKVVFFIHWIPLTNVTWLMTSLRRPVIGARWTIHTITASGEEESLAPSSCHEIRGTTAGAVRKGKEQGAWRGKDDDEGEEWGW